MTMFKIKMPDGHTKIMRYNRETSIEEKMSLVEEHILNRWEESFKNYWLSSNTIKQILDRCATFILLGQSKNAGILTSYKIDKVNSKEIPASNANDTAQNLIYGEYNPSADNASGYASVTLTTQEPSIDLSKISDSQLRKEQEKEAKRVGRWKTSKTRKLYKLFSTPEITTYKLKRVKDNEGNVVTNVFGQAVFIDEKTTIGGNQGFDRSASKAEWCRVDTDNRFIFQGAVYEIDKSVKQYKVGKDNECEMDMILVILADEDIHFFDMNIEEIVHTLIKRV